MLLSLAGDGAARATWPRRDEDAESCFDAVGATWPRRDEDVESSWRWCR
jgi:hypothetical protein